MDYLKAGRILEARLSVDTIRGNLASKEYSDKGTFHRFVTKVDDMQGYFRGLNGIIEDPAIGRDNPWYSLAAQKESRAARQRAESLLERLTREELVYFAEHARDLAMAPITKYRDAIEYLFTFKTSTLPNGEWKTFSVKKEYQLLIFQQIMDLELLSNRLKSKAAI